MKTQEKSEIDDSELSINPGENGEANIEPVKKEDDYDDKLAEAAMEYKHKKQQQHKLVEVLREIQEWNDADIAGFDDITPDMEMLKARQDTIREALKDFET